MTVIVVEFRAKKGDEARKSGDEGLDMDIPDEVLILVSLKSLTSSPGGNPPLPEGDCQWRKKRQLRGRRTGKRMKFSEFGRVGQTNSRKSGESEKFLRCR